MRVLAFKGYNSQTFKKGLE